MITPSCVTAIADIAWNRAFDESNVSAPLVAVASSKFMLILMLWPVDPMMLGPVDAAALTPEFDPMQLQPSELASVVVASAGFKVLPVADLPILIGLGDEIVGMIDELDDAQSHVVELNCKQRLMLDSKQ